MARRITMKEMKHDEFVEAAFDFTHWLEKNWKTVVLIAAAIIVVAFLVYGWIWNAERNREQAEQLVAQGILHYERAQAVGFTDANELSAALDQFDSAIDASRRSRAAESARFYRGAALHRLGRAEDAMAALGEIAGDDTVTPTLAWTATSLLAEVYLEAGQSDRALELLSGAASRDDQAFPTDLALLQLGRIQRESGNSDAARESWQRLVDEFPDSPIVTEAQTLLAQ
jgi:predicted negative regulator of RcsB-dependent stress response